MVKQFLSVRIIFVFIFLLSIPAFAQVVLNANGTTETYALINSVLAPGYNVVEAPDNDHSPSVKHIAQVFDTDLNKQVFEFYSHLAIDKDPSTTSLDRQRIEIKTYDQSPANLKGTLGETVHYKWRFKVPVGYQPSNTFSHLHQVKPVDGDDGDPLFTLTARKGTPNKMELTYTAVSTGSTTKPVVVNLSLFEGKWIEVEEDITIGVSGAYSLVAKDVATGIVVMSYSNNNILTFRPGNTFIRPKWGIYRSIATPTDLRDEAMRFSDFSIGEGGALIGGIIYYYVGGITAASFTDATNWNTLQDGTGTSRTTADVTDELIIDGTNIGGTTPTTGTVTFQNLTGNTIGQFKLQNNAQVILQRSTGTTGTLVIQGDATTDPDFVVAAGSSLTINTTLAQGNVNINLTNTPNVATGLIGGTITLSNTGTHRITSQTADGLVFASGSTFNSAGTPASAAYPFGNGTTQSVNGGVLFQIGSNLVITGNRSPFAGSSTVQAANLDAGSNTYFRISNAAGTGSYTNGKTFGNLFVENGATLTSDGAFFKIDNLTINSGCTMVTHSSGSTPVLGNLTVNGTLSSLGGSSNAVVMAGGTSQTISGAGTISIASFTTSNGSDILLTKAITSANTVNIIGKLDFGASGSINGAASFTSRTNDDGRTAVPGVTTAGSYTITGVTGAASITGLRISGPGIAPNTDVVGFSGSSANINLSKPAISSASGTYTFDSDSATLVISNPNGFNDATGAITVAGTKSFQSGTNLTINGTTTSPIFVSSSLPSQQVLGNLTINAPTTTNYYARVTGLLTLNSPLSIRAIDSLRLINGTSIVGASSSNYIRIMTNGTLTGVLRMDDLVATTTFPVANMAGEYSPVTLVPTSAMDYAVSVFAGTTADGTQAGTPITAPQKLNLVDQTWTVNRINGTGNCDVTLNWPASLEGSSFASFPDGQIGMSRYDGAAYEAGKGTGSNSSNTVTATYGSFSPFIVGQQGAVLPLRTINITASLIGRSVQVKWNVNEEDDVRSYEVQRSYDGAIFESIKSISPNFTKSYTQQDVPERSAVAYYRIKVMKNNGSIKYSDVVKVNIKNGSTINIFPNPASDVLSISGLEAKATVRIFDSKGQLIMKLQNNNSVIQADIQPLAKGAYYIEIIESNGSKQSQRFIKQ